jgi:TP901 family phage tail tape measure protein
MPGNASSIRAGRAHVEVGVRDLMDRGLGKIQAKLRRFQQTTSRIGGSMMGAGAAVSAPLAASVAAFVPFEQALANARAGANLTGEQMKRLQDRALEVSKATGLGSTGIATLMGDLAKAGVNADQAMGDVGETAARFMKVGDLSAADAVEALVSPLNSFKNENLSAARAADLLSQAADSSKASIQSIVQGMGNVAAVAGPAGLTMQDTAAALAVLDQAGIKGAESGTSLRTILLALSTGAGQAGETMAALGINVRDASGKMQPLQGILDEVRQKMAGLDQASRDAAMGSLFGSFGITGANALIAAGGIDEMKKAMGANLSVAQKFDVVMGTTGGQFEKLQSAVGRAGIAIGKTTAGPLSAMLSGTIKLIDATAALATAYPGVTASVTIAAGTLITLGAGLKIASIAAGLAGTSLGVLKVAAVGAKIATLALYATAISPLALGVAAVTAAFVAAGMVLAKFTETGRAAWAGIKVDGLAAFETIKTAIDGVSAALQAGDIGKAGKIAMLGMNLAFAEGTDGLRDLWTDFTSWLSSSSIRVAAKIATVFNNVVSEVAAGMTGIFSDDPAAADMARKMGSESQARIDAWEHDRIGKVNDDAVWSKMQRAGAIGKMRGELAQLTKPGEAKPTAADDPVTPAVNAGSGVALGEQMAEGFDAAGAGKDMADELRGLYESEGTFDALGGARGSRIIRDLKPGEGGAVGAGGPLAPADDYDRSRLAGNANGVAGGPTGSLLDLLPPDALMQIQRAVSAAATMTPSPSGRAMEVTNDKADQSLSRVEQNTAEQNKLLATLIGVVQSNPGLTFANT